MRRQREWSSPWRSRLNDGVVRKHWRWQDGDRASDEGRLALVDAQVQGARVAALDGARLTRCDLSGAHIGHLEDAELVDCIFDEAVMNQVPWRRAKLTNCRLHGGWFGLSDWPNAVIVDSDFLGSYLERADFTGAKIRNTSFRACNLQDSRFDGAWFEDCEFRYASFARKDFALDLARCPGTRFIRCDFRGANLEGLRLNDTAFEDCLFFEMYGKPDLEGPVTLIDPDFSPEGNNAPNRLNVPGVRSEEDVLTAWRTLDGARINHWANYGDKVRYDVENHYPERRRRPT